VAPSLIVSIRNKGDEVAESTVVNKHNKKQSENTLILFNFFLTTLKDKVPSIKKEERR
jgi:hypothetical protein